MNCSVMYADNYMRNHDKPYEVLKKKNIFFSLLNPGNKFPSQILSDYVPSVSRRIYENGFVIILFSLSYHSFLTRGLTESFEEIFSRILCESSYFLKPIVNEFSWQPREALFFGKPETSSPSSVYCCFLSIWR